jgi:hypothetical protein
MTLSNKSFRYNTTGRWFKGNTHIHSNASDGGISILEIAELYLQAKYDFIFCTDHMVSSDIAKTCQNPPLLILDGIELDGQDNNGTFFHVVCLGKTVGITREDDIADAIRKAREQNAILVLAHPHWCGNSLEDTNRWGFDGVEIYNHQCRWLNGKSDGLVHWDAMLKKNPNTLNFAADDAHFKPEHPGWNGAWIVVNAAELTKEAILAAIKHGNFYSSCGPEFKSISQDNNFLHIESTPVQFIRLVGPASCGWRVGSFDGKLLTQVSVEIPVDWNYIYIELEDKEGKRAWSNTLFVTKYPSHHSS